MARLSFLVLLTLYLSFASAISFKSLSAATLSARSSVDLDVRFGNHVCIIQASTDAENALNIVQITALAGGGGNVHVIDVSAANVDTAGLFALVQAHHTGLAGPCTDVVFAGHGINGRVHWNSQARRNRHRRSDTFQNFFNAFDVVAFAGVHIHFAACMCDAVEPSPVIHARLGLCENAVITPIVHNGVNGWLRLPAMAHFVYATYQAEYETPIINVLIANNGVLPNPVPQATDAALQVLNGRTPLEFLTINGHQVQRSAYPGCVYGHEIKTDSEWIPTSISCGERLDIALEDGSKLYLTATHSIFVKPDGKGALQSVPAGKVKKGDVVMFNDKKPIPIVSVSQSEGRLVNVWAASGHFWLDGVKVAVEVDESKAEIMKRVKELDPQLKAEPAGTFVLNEKVFEHRQEIMAAWTKASKDKDMLVAPNLKCWDEALKAAMGVAGTTVAAPAKTKTVSEVQKVEKELKMTPGQSSKKK